MTNECGYDYDDPAVEQQWCDERQQQVIDYLESQGVAHGEVGEWPAWHLAPYVSIWAIESLAHPGSVGWWAICGDLPTDYLSADRIKHPRQAMQAFAKEWKLLSEFMARGEAHPNSIIGLPDNWIELAPLLSARANSLSDFVGDDSLWEE